MVQFGGTRFRVYVKMGRGDHCAVFMCNNDRRYSNSWLVKDHVRELKWHYCPPKYRKLWQRLLNRQDFHITDNTRICSNHFVLGRPCGKHLHPCLYMRGYTEAKESHKDNAEIQQIISTWGDTVEETDYIRTRQWQIKRKLNDSKGPTVFKKHHSCEVDHNYSASLLTTQYTSSELHDNVSEPIANASPYKSSSYSFSDMVEEHCYSSRPQSSAACTCVKCDVCKLQYKEMENENSMLQNELEHFRRMLGEDRSGSVTLMDNYDIRNIKHSDKLVMLHTGLQSYALFEWLYKTVEPKLSHLQYYKDSQSDTGKSYQLSKKVKPGPKRRLSHENELLVTLMKLKLNLSENFLSHLFGTSTSVISQIHSTWLPLLSYELKPLLHWPTPEELSLYSPDCFRKYKRVTAIIDCTEVPIQTPSLAKANTRIYSTHKGRPTAKILVACTPAGTISFVSKAAGGNMSDEEMVKRSGFLDYLQPGDTILADRGCNIQELLLEKHVTLIIPPFLCGKEQFSLSEDKTTKTVSNARIHVERVIGRMKEFNIMKGELPLHMFDIFDHIVTIVAALVNMLPQIVPLNCKYRGHI